MASTLTSSALHMYHMKRLLLQILRQSMRSGSRHEPCVAYLYGANGADSSSMSFSDMYFQLPFPLAFNFDTSLPMNAAMPRLRLALAGSTAYAHSIYPDFPAPPSSQSHLAQNSSISGRRARQGNFEDSLDPQVACTEHVHPLQPKARKHFNAPFA